MSLYEENYENLHKGNDAENAEYIEIDAMTDTPVEYKEAATNIEYAIDVGKSTVFLNGEIAEGCLVDFILRVNAVLKMRPKDKKNDPINIFINSDGGHVYEALGIIDYINTLDVPVNTICRGRAMSAAALILCSATGKRYASKYSFIMIHEVSSELYGTATNMRENMKHTECIEKYVLEILSKNTKRDIDFWKNESKRDYYMNASEAKELGIIDEIIDYQHSRNVK